MRYVVTVGDDNIIHLPSDLMQALGQAKEVEVTRHGNSLMFAPVPGRTPEELVAAIDAYRARYRDAPDVGFTPEEWAKLRADSRQVEAQRADKILALFAEMDESQLPCGPSNPAVPPDGSGAEENSG